MTWEDGPAKLNLTRPLSPRRAASTSERERSPIRRIAAAGSSSACPAGVSSTRRVVRSNSGVPRSASSARMVRLR